jgi:hypothetical protein
LLARQRLLFIQVLVSLQILPGFVAPGGLHLRCRLGHTGVLHYVSGLSLGGLQVSAGCSEISHRLLVIGFDLRQRYVVLLRVDGNQRLTAFDIGVIIDIDRLHVAGHAGQDRSRIALDLGIVGRFIELTVVVSLVAKIATDQHHNSNNNTRQIRL